jgi:hypothetical protein
MPSPPGAEVEFGPESDTFAGVKPHRLLWLLALTTAIGGCGVAVASPDGSASFSPAASNRSQSLPTAGPRSARRAFALWSGFRSAATPRPIVPIGTGPVIGPRDGFRTDAAKIAFIEGRYVLRATVPVAPPSRAGYAIKSARQALRLLRSDPGKVGSSTVGPLAVTRIRLAAASFLTDRGNKLLPAWAFSLRGVAHPVFVLAIARSSVFTPPNPRQFARGVGPFEDDTATVSADGMSLRVSFTGGPAGHKPCDIAYSPGATANVRAVAFWVTPHPVPTTGACSLVGYTRIVTIHLKRRLGARVLIDAADGGPIAVRRAR